MHQTTQYVIVDTDTKRFLTVRSGKFTENFAKARILRQRNHATYALRKLRENANTANLALAIKSVQIVCSDAFGAVS